MTWFPVFDEQITYPGLTPAEKLYFWSLVSEFNYLDGPFYRPDLYFAAALNLSEEKIRKARRKLQGLGWIETKPGFRSKRGQNLATSYKYVAFSQPPEEGRFVKFHRYTFEVMLHYIRQNKFSHADVVVYVYLYFLWNLLGDSFFVSKRQLQEYTGVRKAVECVRNLYDKFQFSNGEPLFNYKDDYHRLTFTAWRTFADPAENENNAKNAVLYCKEIKERFEQLRKAKTEKEKRKARQQGILFPEDLPELFRQYYARVYGKPATIYYGQEEELVRLGSEYGAGAVAEALRIYFTADVVPNSTNAKTRTLANFLKNINLFISNQKEFSGAG